jgi:hypothetical protein
MQTYSEDTKALILLYYGRLPKKEKRHYAALEASGIAGREIFPTQQ